MISVNDIVNVWESEGVGLPKEGIHKRLVTTFITLLHVTSIETSALDLRY